LLLLDTCTFVWLAAEPDRLSPSARTLLDDASESLVLSDVSVWELGLKWQLGKMQLPEPPRRWVETQAEVWHLERQPVERSHIYRTTELAPIHRDPFDRLLVAQAIEHDYTLVTPDREIAKYPVVVRW
jgi:PIN domain nuclease of toxin-antitoxin system